MDMLKEAFANLKARHLVIVLIVLLVFVGFSAARCVSVHTEAPAETETESVSSGEESSGTPEAEEPELSEEQQDLVDAYDADVTEFVNLLCANAWSAQGETKTVTFTDRSFTETDSNNGEQVSHTYAVSSYEESTTTESGANGETQQVTLRNVAILTDSGTYLLTMRQFNTGSDQGSTWSLTSNGFQYSYSYVLSEASQSLTVSALNSMYEELIGGHTDALRQAVSDYCSRYYPTATEATWTQQANADWASNHVTTTFELNNSSGSEITVVYDMQSGGFTVD